MLTLTIPEFALFTRYNCAWTHLADAAEALKPHARGGDFLVVVNRKGTLGADRDRVRKELERVGRPQVADARRLTHQVIRRVLASPVDPEQTADFYGLQYFVAPDIALPGDLAGKDPVGALQRWLQGDLDTDASLAVLLAPAGVGKTTVAQELYRRIADSSAPTIPLLVERDQWAGLLGRDWLEMRDIWASAIADRHAGAVVGPEQLELYIGSGTICPIFDGLDELCSMFVGLFNATDTVEELIASVGAGRLLVTSRDRYWMENVAAATRAKTLELDLSPFSPAQRNTYLEKRFADAPEKRARAEKILDRIGHSSYVKQTSRVPSSAVQDRLQNVPFVVMFAAESADTTKSDADAKFGHLLSSEDPMGGLIVAFCDRERQKHHMTVAPNDQVRVFEMVACEFSEEFSSGDLELAIEIVLGTSEHDQFFDHALLQQRGSSFRFRFPFLHAYLIGRVIAAWLAEGSTSDANSSAHAAMATLAERGNAYLDMSADIVSRALTTGWEARARERLASLKDEHRAGFTCLVIRLAGATVSGVGDDTSVRTMLAILGDPDDRSFSDLHLRGVIERVDLTGVEFHSCTFADIEWAGCQFDGNTRFDDCRFEGGLSATNCEGLGDACFEPSCSMSSAVRAALQNLQKNDSRVPITQDQIFDAVANVLRRFRRGPGFMTRKREGVEKTVRRQVIFGKDLLAALVTEGVLNPLKSGSNAIFKVGNTHDARVLLENRQAIGSVKAAVDRLQQKLNA